MKFKIILTLFLINIIAACTTSPKYIVLSPELTGYSKGIYFDKKVQFNVIDQRSSSQVVQILKDNEPAHLLSSQDSLTNIINKSISPILRSQGLTIDTYANTKIDIIINTALINVQQNLINYTAKNMISLKVLVSTADKVISKDFNATGQSNGPLTADIAVLERDFNNQLASLLVKIVNNNEIQNTIKASESAY